MQLFIFQQTVVSDDFKTVITKEYLPINKEDIEWRHELTESNQGEAVYRYMGYVPYVNGIKTDIYQYKMGKSKMIMSSLLADDGSFRLYPQHFEYFNCPKIFKTEGV